MTNQTPQVENLKAMLALHEKRARVQQELDAIDSQLASLQNNLGSPSPARSGTLSLSAAPARRGRKPGKSGRRGQLRDRIFAALEAAGSNGVKVMPLAEALGSEPANIYAWFHGAVKRYPQIKKLEGAHYRLEGAKPATVSVNAESSAPAQRGRKPGKAGKPSKAAKRGGRKAPRGGMKEKIIEALGKAGSAGMTVKALSEKIGANYKNIQVWFATTGKKVSGLKKIAPAHYRMS